MSIIDTQNAKRIRDPMQVHCGITSRSDKINLDVAVSGSIKVIDSNISTSIDSENWTMQNLTDLQGEGFALDGSCKLYDAKEASLDDGKAGVRTEIGGDMAITISSSGTIPAVTMAFTGNSKGTISADGNAYDIRRIVVIPVNGKTITLTMSNGDPESRIELASITPGITLDLNNENLVSCTLALRSDLSIGSPSWQISDIEIKAYWPDDISEAISNVNDDVPIYYYSGYEGDYSRERKFYLSEPASMEENVITLKGEDASHKLEDAKSVTLQRLETKANDGQKKLYNWLCTVIKEAGIKPEYIQDAPLKNGTIKTERSMVMSEASRREHVQSVINLSHYKEFWPVFVDAGIPEITWSKPGTLNRNGRYPIWIIHEEDCGEVTRTVERQVAKIKSDDENGVRSTVTRKKKWTKLKKNLKIKKGEQIIKNFSGEYYWSYKVANKAKTIWNLIDSFAWIPSKTSVKKKVKTKEKYKSGKKKGQYKTVKKWFYRPNLYGKKLTISKSNSAIAAPDKRPGTVIDVNPLAFGKIFQGEDFIYPNYERLFDRSNICGSFTFKGDPRMQPRDIFKFVRKDKDENGETITEICTIESITLTHEEGGTSAELTYRKGVV